MKDKPDKTMMVAKLSVEFVEKKKFNFVSHFIDVGCLWKRVINSSKIS